MGLKKLALIPILFSSTCLANNYDLALNSSYQENSHEYFMEIDRREERAKRYFKGFVALKSLEYALDEIGYLKSVKRGVRFVDELRTFHTANYGNFIYGGDRLQIENFMDVKDTYLEIKFDLSGKDKFELSYSVRF